MPQQIPPAQAMAAMIGAILLRLVPGIRRWD